MSEPRPAIIVRDVRQTVAALSAARSARREIFLLSAPHAAGFLGASGFLAIVAVAAAEVPGARFEAVLDCGSDAGWALSAIRANVDAIVFDARSPANGRIEGIAEQSNVRVVRRSVYGDSLDLAAVGDPGEACHTYLSNKHEGA